MSEFSNRISAQRSILEIVNRIEWKEELFGLSSGAIARWSNVNEISRDSEIVSLIDKAAEKLFFLSNKSQEQITEDYRRLSADVADLESRIECSVKKYSDTIVAPNTRFGVQ